MTAEERAAEVERLTELLERDVIGIDEFNTLVSRVLAATEPLTPPLVLHCASGVVKETPTYLPENVEIRCESGVLKVDLSQAELGSAVIDLDIEMDNGVAKVIVPRDAIVEVEDHVASGGVFANKVKAVKAESWRPRIFVHVRNNGGVLKLTRPRRWG